MPKTFPALINCFVISTSDTCLSRCTCPEPVEGYWGHLTIYSGNSDHFSKLTKFYSLYTNAININSVSVKTQNSISLMDPTKPTLAYTAYGT